MAARFARCTVGAARRRSALTVLGAHRWSPEVGSNGPSGLLLSGIVALEPGELLGPADGQLVELCAEHRQRARAPTTDSTPLPEIRVVAAPPVEQGFGHIGGKAIMILIQR